MGGGGGGHPSVRFATRTAATIHRANSARVGPDRLQVPAIGHPNALRSYRRVRARFFFFFFFLFLFLFLSFRSLPMQARARSAIPFFLQSRFPNQVPPWRYDSLMRTGKRSSDVRDGLDKSICESRRRLLKVDSPLRAVLDRISHRSFA